MISIPNVIVGLDPTIQAPGAPLDSRLRGNDISPIPNVIVGIAPTIQGPRPPSGFPPALMTYHPFPMSLSGSPRQSRLPGLLWIPACAGMTYHPFPMSFSGLPRQSRLPGPLWIPACAGMTESPYKNVASGSNISRFSASPLMGEVGLGSIDHRRHVLRSGVEGHLAPRAQDESPTFSHHVD